MGLMLLALAAALLVVGLLGLAIGTRELGQQVDALEARVAQLEARSRQVTGAREAVIVPARPRLASVQTLERHA